MTSIKANCITISLSHRTYRLFVQWNDSQWHVVYWVWSDVYMYRCVQWKIQLS